MSVPGSPSSVWAKRLLTNLGNMHQLVLRLFERTGCVPFSVLLLCSCTFSNLPTYFGAAGSFDIGS